MYQHARVRQVLLEIHSSNVARFQQHHHIETTTHVIRHHVVQIQIVAIMLVKLFARVNQIISEPHQVVVQSVLLILNVRTIELALIVNALILVQIHVELVLCVILQIIIQFAPVQRDILEIHLHNAQEYVRFDLNFVFIENILFIKRFELN